MEMLRAVLSYAATATLLLVSMGSAPSFAEETCPLGFNLTSGGVAEADLNGDGLTCEAAGTFDGLPAVIAVDNGPLDGSSGGSCPDGFTRVPAKSADRNGNGFECTKIVSSPQGFFVVIVIDDNKPTQD